MEICVLATYRHFQFSILHNTLFEFHKFPDCWNNQNLFMIDADKCLCAKISKIIRFVDFDEKNCCIFCGILWMNRYGAQILVMPYHLLTRRLRELSFCEYILTWKLFELTYFELKNWFFLFSCVIQYLNFDRFCYFNPICKRLYIVRFQVENFIIC